MQCELDNSNEVKCMKTMHKVFLGWGCCKVLTIYMKVNFRKVKDVYSKNPRSRTKKEKQNKTNNLTKKGKKPILKQSKAKKQTTKTKQMQNFSIQKKVEKERRKGNEQIG